MKLVMLTKSSVNTGDQLPPADKVATPIKTKYFLDHMQAAFHIMANACSFKLNIELCLALQMGDDYYPVTKATQKPAPEFALFAKNEIYTVESVSNNDDTADYGIGTYTDTITTDISGYNKYGARNLYIGENGDLYWLGEKCRIENALVEYKQIQPTVDSALTASKKRLATESQNQFALFKQKEQDLKRLQDELRQVEGELKEKKELLDTDFAGFPNSASKRGNGM